MNNGDSGFIEKKGINDRHNKNKRHTIDTTRPCVHYHHYSSASPLFQQQQQQQRQQEEEEQKNKDNNNNTKRRHSTIIGSHSSGLLRNCSGTAFLRQHRKALSLDTTPLLSDNPCYYDNNLITDRQKQKQKQKQDLASKGFLLLL